MIPEQTEEPFTETKILEESPKQEFEYEEASPTKKKDKKLVFLSRSVL